MDKLYRGVFWIKDAVNLDAIVVKEECDDKGMFLGTIDNRRLSKAGCNFNHEAVWKTLSRNITEGRPYNYYPRGRVEIRSGRAVIFANANIACNRLISWCADEFNLTKENGIKSISLKADGSLHYLCYMDK